MADYLIRTDDLGQMADAVLLIMEFARAEPDKFTFGPLEQQPLMTSGLFLLGEADRVADRLRKYLPDVTIVQNSA